MSVLCPRCEKYVHPVSTSDYRDSHYYIVTKCPKCGHIFFEWHEMRYCPRCREEQARYGGDC